MSVRNDCSQVSTVSPTASALTLQTRISTPPSSAAEPSIHCFNAVGSATSVGLPQALTPLPLQGFDDAIDLLRLPSANRDIGAFGGEQIRDRPADSLASACDEGILAFQSQIHASLLG